MDDGLTLSEIADALDALADAMVSDQISDLAGYNASFWRDVAVTLRQQVLNEIYDLAVEIRDKLASDTGSLDRQEAIETLISEETEKLRRREAVLEKVKKERLKYQTKLELLGKDAFNEEDKRRFEMASTQVSSRERFVGESRRYIEMLQSHLVK